MLKKVLAVCHGHEITAQFLDENEYNMYCRKVMRTSLDIALKNLSIEELIDLWQEKNGVLDNGIADSAEPVGAVMAANR